jgi:Tol biopolymer transport system component
MKKRAGLGRLFGVLIAVVACDGNTGEPTGPDTSELPEFVPLVSNPVHSTGASQASVAETDLVYVSLPPGTIEDGVEVTIVNQRTGARVDGFLVNGGFDPLPIAAEVGDTLGASVALLDGTHKTAKFTVPPGRKLIVVRTEPPPGKRDVPLNSNLIVVLSEPVDPGSLTPGSIQLRRNVESVDISLELMAGSPWSVRIRPSSALQPGTTYQLVLTAALRDQGGEPLGVETTISFTTTEEPLPPPGEHGPPVIAFVSTRGVGVSSPLQKPSIYLADAEGRVISRVAEGDSPAWSPDGTRLAFQRTVHVGPGVDRTDIMVANLDGSKLEVLAEGGAHPNWSPDGTTIIFDTESGRENKGIIAVDVVTREKRVLIGYRLDVPAEWGEGWKGHASYSPDGTTIAFIWDLDIDGRSVWLTDADGSHPRTLVDGSCTWPPRWSPDGLRLLLGRWSCMLRSIGLDGSYSRYYAAGAFVSDPAWHPDGTSVVFTWVTGPPTSASPTGTRRRIFITPIARSEPRQLIADDPDSSPEYADTQPTWYRPRGG